METRYEWRKTYFWSMNTAVLSIGSNMGDRLDWIRKAYQLLIEAGVLPVIDSSVYESEAWGFLAETSFYNTVLVGETHLTPDQLLSKIHEIEDKLGRIRSETDSYCSRNIDIDIVFFNKLVIHKTHLRIPHPHFRQRNFVLAPLNEVIPNFTHPLIELPINELYQHSDDRNKVFVVHSPLLNRQ